LFTYHNIKFYGLAQGDYRTVHGKNVEKWIALEEECWGVKRFMAEIRMEAS
jgi:hypothetical protein